MTYPERVATLQPTCQLVTRFNSDAYASVAATAFVTGLNLNGANADGVFGRHSVGAVARDLDLNETALWEWVKRARIARTAARA